MEWISVEKAMPPEKESMFARFYGTGKWNTAMFKTISDNVLVTIELENGSRIVDVCRTIDGKWKIERGIIKQKVIYWSPLPEPPKE